ncbi:sensor histidine kinase [Vibrio europaeus]|uniref:sensor histidine kinase n=1 Tax=Vibrio europaeus TaxID=300876 RepID=UPI00148DB67D|nr:sensor histidine kinase [Vibrio europaeus]NOH22347.1 sensor histidine kinase [Vibrio europaeus]
MATTSEQEKPDPLKLKIDAHVIKQLGAELISGPDIALVELIKNSHDADASFCYIEVDTEYQETIEYVEIIDGKKVNTKQTYKGRISVKDNGHGMNRDRIDRSWLTVSYSEKKEAKEQGLITQKYDRTFVGDKGLGRLGSMQLGALCRISTHDKANEPGIAVSFDWDDFSHGKTIDTIRIDEKVLPEKPTSGTTIEAIGLRDIEFWEGQKSNYIKNKIASMVSPHGQISNFKTYYVCNGVNEELEVVSNQLLEQASSIFNFEVTRTEAIVTGQIDLMPYKPSSTDSRRAPFDSHVLSDNGLALLEYIGKHPRLKGYEFVHSKGKYFLSFEHRVSFDEMSTTLVSDNFPGVFKAKIFNFVLTKESLNLEEISWKATRETIKEISGDISVYRDGFKVGSGDKDWLGLSKDMTSGSAAYSLRPANVTGYVNLSWYDNKYLIEKSDRESFVDNHQYRAFYTLCRHFIDTVNHYLNSSRRITHSFLDEKVLEDAGKPKGYSAKQATAELDSIVKKSVTLQPKVTKSAARIKKTFTEKRHEIDRAIDENQQDMFSDPILAKKLASIKELVTSLESEVNTSLKQYKAFTDDLANHIHSTTKVIKEIQNYENQIKNFYDHVAIGLSAQTLAHEANEQIRNTRLHLNAAKKRVEDLGIKDVPLFKELNGIRGDTQVLSKAISSLNPLVKAQRQIMEEINLSDFLNDYIELREGYFSGKGIIIHLLDEKNSKSVSFNRGKLYQIIDNIVRNSEHWLSIFKAHYPQDAHSISITVNKNVITIWDSAKGIRPAIEDVLFDMFATDKEYGQGLGLYIVQTLLKERGCSIKLLEERNKFGRRYKFQIDLIEALV